jgi:hypothetical protein
VDPANWGATVSQRHSSAGQSDHRH